MKLVLLLMIMGSFIACVGNDASNPPPKDAFTSVEVPLEDSRADRIERWRVRHSDTTFWFNPNVKINDKVGKINARSSRNLIGVISYFSSGETIQTTIVSPRIFELELNKGQIIKAASGEPIFTTVNTSVGKRHTLTRFAPRLNGFEGDHRIYVLGSMNATYVGNELAFRGRVATTDGWELLNVQFGKVPASLVYEPHLSPFDFNAELMPSILDEDQQITFTAYDGADQFVKKSVNFGLRLNRFAASDLSPYEVWPRESCHPDTHSCLRKYDGDDFETCGYANQISACWSPYAIDFSRRLGEEISGYYDENVLEMKSENRRSKRTALARISPNKVGQVDPLEDEDSANEQDETTIVYHPGVVFRGSSVLWQGHYDKNGDFQFMEKIN